MEKFILDSGNSDNRFFLYYHGSNKPFFNPFDNPSYGFLFGNYVDAVFSYDRNMDQVKIVLKDISNYIQKQCFRIPNIQNIVYDLLVLKNMDVEKKGL
jgi:hypothetical protein